VQERAVEVTGVVEGGVERVEGRLQRKCGRDGADHVIECRRHRARWDQRQERERQAEHEGEQRGRPHRLPQPSSRSVLRSGCSEFRWIWVAENGTVAVEGPLVRQFAGA
jgi:hypothetical protein